MKDAVSFRTRKTSIYDKKSNTPFKISRSKFFNFMSCKRCFYLDRVKGLKEPSMPGWALNVAVDELLKKEFDEYRKEQKPHPIMVKVNTDWIEKKIIEMKDVLNLDEPPKIEKTCEKCAYLEGGKKF